MSSTLYKTRILESLDKLKETERNNAIAAKQYNELKSILSKRNHTLLSQQLSNDENKVTKPIPQSLNRQRSYDKISSRASTNCKSRRTSDKKSSTVENFRRSISDTERFVASTGKKELQMRILQYHNYVNSINKKTAASENQKLFSHLLEKQNSVMWKSYKTCDPDLMLNLECMLTKLSM